MKNIALLLVLLFSQMNFSQYNSLRIGGIIVELGIEYDYAINLFNKAGIITKEVGTDAPNKFFYLHWIDDKFNFIGSVSFINGKLSTIQKFWGPYKVKDNSSQFLNDYFEILKSFGDKTINTRLKVTEYHEPDVKQKEIILSKGNKDVELSYTPVEIHITERISQ